MSLLLGGHRAVREFKLGRYITDEGNREAFGRAVRFRPARDNLYFRGPCGVGKTHLAFALARRSFIGGLSAQVTTPGRLIRQIRFREPADQQTILDRLIHSEVLVLDDLGMGPESAYFRQVFQEILDGRWYAGRNGLVITSKFSLAALADRWQDDTIPSRLAGLCKVIAIDGNDRRMASRAST